jgi:octaprenyl-diphosphate synthase
MQGYDAELSGVSPADSCVGKSAGHLLALGGKRLRPMCVSLTARIGGVSGQAVMDLGVAAELVHMATLLHDDVVDGGELRRGAPAARVLYGNAASVFAGDWLLVEALRRVQRSRVARTLDTLLNTIDEMITAEAEQLERRGMITVDRESYFSVVEGKTAALFRWAMQSGGRAGGLDEVACDALSEFGRHLGIAFQLVDDLLDYTGDAGDTGKHLFADLEEGKLTYPLILGLERDPSIEAVLRSFQDAPPDERPPLASALVTALSAQDVVADTRARAEEHGRRAIEHLHRLPPGDARTALETVMMATIQRDR